MAVLIADKRLFYAPIPKAACTSIKTMFFEAEHGRSFEDHPSGKKEWWQIHNHYVTGLRDTFPEAEIRNFRRITVVRDPIKRFLSAYSNRVLHHKRANDDAVRSIRRLRKVTPDPDLSEFIDRLKTYQRIEDIHWHTRPMVDFLGADPSYFDAVYDVSQLGAFVQDVSNTLGRPVKLGRLQTGGPKIDADVLTAKQRETLETYYKADYRAFGAYL